MVYGARQFKVIDVFFKEMVNNIQKNNLFNL